MKTSNEWNYHIAWLMEVNACCAVNCYALISGYVSVKNKNSQNRICKYLSMWVQVFFYSVGITLIAFLFNHESIGIRALLESLFPVATNQYWYFACYTALFFLMPWLNRFIQIVDKRELTKFVALLIMMFSFFLGYITTARRRSVCNFLRILCYMADYTLHNWSRDEKIQCY